MYVVDVHPGSLLDFIIQFRSDAYSLVHISKRLVIYTGLKGDDAICKTSYARHITLFSMVCNPHSITWCNLLEECFAGWKFVCALQKIFRYCIFFFYYYLPNQVLATPRCLQSLPPPHCLTIVSLPEFMNMMMGWEVWRQQSTSAAPARVDRVLDAWKEESKRTAGFISFFSCTFTATSPSLPPSKSNILMRC